MKNREQLSKYTILTPVKDSDRYVIVNLLSGNADILDADRARSIMTGSDADMPELIQKGYAADTDTDERMYRNAYLDFIEKRESSEIQIFFVPWYSCNFACAYCYQEGYPVSGDVLTPHITDVIDAFYAYTSRVFAKRKKYITLFGGEPLLPGDAHRNTIALILDGAAAHNMDVAIVTNGYALDSYVELFTRAHIREVQVTLDGIRQVHNRRRPLQGGGGTFDSIVKGIDRCLDAQYPVNLRVVIDRDNINDLPSLAQYAIDRGWTAHPLFKTQLGRNYELHHCQSRPDLLFDRLSLYEKLYEMIKTYPHILEFHRPAFSVSRFLYDNGTLPGPLFDACPACKTEWAFDYTGHIYPCTANVGKAGEDVGMFYRSETVYQDRIDEWTGRDTAGISSCRSCSVQHLCGGGCGAVAKNKTGSLLSTDCRPVQELLGMGISHYFNKGEI